MVDQSKHFTHNVFNSTSDENAAGFNSVSWLYDMFLHQPNKHTGDEKHLHKPEILTTDPRRASGTRMYNVETIDKLATVFYRLPWLPLGGYA
jgi:hypothetical protein